MGIPYRFDPMGTLGTSPLPPGWHEVEKVYLGAANTTLNLFTAPEENIPAWDNELDVLLDVECDDYNDAGRRIAFEVGQSAELGLAMQFGGGGGAAVVCGETYSLLDWRMGRMTVTVQNGMVRCFANGEEKKAVALTERPGGVESGFIKMNRTRPHVYLRRSHYFSHGLRYEFIPCQNGAGENAFFETRTQTLKLL